jgi:hypothetical protein
MIEVGEAKIAPVVMARYWANVLTLIASICAKKVLHG